MAPTARFIATMNYGYAGTRELNEALASRFVVIQMPAISPENLDRLLKHRCPELKQKYRQQFVSLFFDLQKKCEGGEISSKALDLRGLLDALELMAAGVPSGPALDMGITNKTADGYEQGLIRDVMAARVSPKLTRGELFGPVSAHHTAGQRRALNQVWNGAGIYGFEPLFLSLNSDGNPNLYLNTIVGCVRKWYGEEGPARLFQAWAGDRRQALLDDLAWLALESAAYQLELPQRPILADLRRDWAVEFFDKEHTLSRQEWMAKNQLSYTMQSARWKAVLGMRPPVMTPYERRLSAALALGPMKEQELFPAILELFARFRLFDGRSRPPSALRLHLTGKWAGVMTRLMPTEIVHTDVASVGHGKGSDEGDSTKLDIRRASIRLKEDISSDRLYIQSCFGPSLLPQRELAAENEKLTAAGGGGPVQVVSDPDDEDKDKNEGGDEE